MLVSLTVGKVDAGVAVLLTQDNRLVSFLFVPLVPAAMDTCDDGYLAMPKQTRWCSIFCSE